MTLALELWGPSHLTVLALTVLIPGLLIGIVRWNNDPRVATRLGFGLAAVLLLSKVGTLTWAVHWGRANALNMLPMHLCDWAAVVAIIALISRNLQAYELAYFWGLAGTFQAMLTPDLNYEFPSFEFITFFVSHGGIIVAALFLTFAYRLRPRKGAVVRTLLWTNGYVAAALVVNDLTGENYGYLSAKPANASLLDHLGPWPWYILVLEVFATVLFLLLYAPFFFRDRARRNR